MTLGEQELVEGAPVAPRRPRKALTIGAVAKLLSKEFDDVSISKIRFLEERGLVARGGRGPTPMRLGRARFGPEGAWVGGRTDE